MEYKENPEKVFYEVGMDPFSKSGDSNELEIQNSGNWESNTEYYQDRIKEKRSFSDFKDLNPNFSYYEYDYTQKDSVFFSVGRHDFSDVMKYDVEVRDTEAPVFSNANADGELPLVTIGKWQGKEDGANVTPENPNIGWPAVADSCPQIDISWEATLLEEGEQHLVYLMEYTATDLAIEPNSSTARQQVTVDKTTFAKKPAKADETFWVYPNPANNTLHVRFKNPKATEPSVFKIFTLTGQPVQHFTKNTIQENITVNVGHLPPGMYILQLSANNTVLQKTFVKQ